MVVFCRELDGEGVSGGLYSLLWILLIMFIINLLYYFHNKNV